MTAFDYIFYHVFIYNISNSRKCFHFHTIWFIVVVMMTLFILYNSLVALGMRILGYPLSLDKKIILGESDLVPLDLLHYLVEETEKLKKLDLN